MLLVIVVGVYLIFYFKMVFIEKYPEKQTLIGVLTAVANTVLIAVMSNLYFLIAYKLNDWQNHRKDYLKTNALAVKLILYEFVNNYYPLFYIAFIKKSTMFGKRKNNAMDLKAMIHVWRKLKFNYIQLY